MPSLTLVKKQPRTRPTPRSDAIGGRRANELVLPLPKRKIGDSCWAKNHQRGWRRLSYQLPRRTSFVTPSRRSGLRSTTQRQLSFATSSTNCHDHSFRASSGGSGPVGFAPRRHFRRPICQSPPSLVFAGSKLHRVAPPFLQIPLTSRIWVATPPVERCRRHPSRSSPA